MVRLFEPLKLRRMAIPNRVFMSPMCMHLAQNGHPTDWHQVHYGARAVGGVGLVMVEATGVLPERRISPGCLGLWSEAHAVSLRLGRELLLNPHWPLYAADQLGVSVNWSHSYRRGKFRSEGMQHHASRCVPDQRSGSEGVPH